MNIANSSHHSFIIHCWRDQSAHLRGKVINAASRRSYEFSTKEEMVGWIEEITCHSNNTPFFSLTSTVIKGETRNETE